MLRMAREGRLDPALIVVGRTIDLVLPAPQRAMVEKLGARSVVEVLGVSELDRVRMYAALVGEEGAIHELRQDADRALRCYRRSLELYDAIAAAGGRLLEADHDRITTLRTRLVS